MADDAPMAHDKGHRCTRRGDRRKGLLRPPLIRLHIVNGDAAELPELDVQVLIAVLTTDYKDALPCAKRIVPVERRQLHGHCLAAHSSLCQEAGRRRLRGLACRRLLGSLRRVGRLQLRHAVHLPRGFHRGAADYEDLPVVEGRDASRCPRHGQLRLQQRPPPGLGVEELHSRQQLRPAKDVVAPANGGQVAIAHGDDACASSCYVQLGAGGPSVGCRVVDLAVPQGLHEGLIRRRSRGQRATADGEDQPMQGGATVAPTRTSQSGALQLPRLRDWVKDLASCQQALRDAPLVVAADDHEPAIRQHRGRAASAPREHAGARPPPAMPRVEHLDGVEGLLLLVPAPHYIELVRLRPIKAQERRYALAVQAAWQLAAGAAAAGSQEVERRRCARLDPPALWRRRPACRTSEALHVCSVSLPRSTPKAEPEERQSGGAKGQRITPRAQPLG
mmetsp:Transcript_6390/g.19300  ORF Transcript_6390/g.19300 Transcript_6390/m.19300 type:complete len:448 (+) Transcript_6390:165-1508(+)